MNNQELKNLSDLMNDTLGPVEPIIPQLRKSFDFLISKGYLSSFNHLNYFEQLKEVIFSDMMVYLKTKEKHYIPERSESIKYFSVLMERQLQLISRDKIGNRWRTLAQREYNLNQLVNG